MKKLRKWISPIIIVYRFIYFHCASFFFDDRIRILHIGQIQSPHFRNFDLQIKKIQSESTKSILNYYVCSYPDFTKVRSGLIFDYYNYCIFNEYNLTSWLNNLMINARSELEPVSKAIRLLIPKFRPHIIWVHDLQSGGYLLKESIELDDHKFTLILTTYGNDLYFFKGDDHSRNIKYLMSVFDFIHVETRRDLQLAKDFGYKKKFLPIMNAGLRVHLKSSVKAPSKNRDIYILIKGSYPHRSCLYEFFDCVAANTIFFSDKKIIIFGASVLDYEMARITNTTYDTSITCVPHMKQLDIFNLMERSRFHLSLTLSDGLSNTCAESILHGAIPLMTKHNGFGELIDSKYKKLTIFEMPLTEIFIDSLVRLDSDPDLHNELLTSLLTNTLNSYSENHLQAYISEIYYIVNSCQARSGGDGIGQIARQ